MHKFNSTFGGIGTGAGVAWPLFGILSSALSLGVGGTFAISLGCICGFLFLAVSIPVFYISYKRANAVELKLDQKIHLIFSGFLNSIEEFDKIFPNNGENCPKIRLQLQFIQFLKLKNSILLTNINLHEASKQELLASLINDFIKQPNIKKDLSSLPISHLSDTAFMSFVGVFGSIAGCSAGLMGVFVTLGIISGFGALPILAAVVLSAATGLGVFAAVHNTKTEIEQNRKIQIYKSFKKFNRDFPEKQRIYRQGRSVVTEKTTVPLNALEELNTNSAFKLFDSKSNNTPKNDLEKQAYYGMHT